MRGWNRPLSLVAALLALGAPITAAATVYKWTDEDGNVHFTQTPPPESGATDVEGSGKGLGGGLRLDEGAWYHASGGELYRLEFGVDRDEERFALRRVEGDRYDYGKGREIRGRWSLAGARLTLDFGRKAYRTTQRARGGEPFASFKGQQVRLRLEQKGADRVELGNSRTRLDGRWLALREREIDGGPEDGLVGRWRHRGCESTVQFRRNGTFEIRGRLHGSDELGRYAYGTWRLYDPVLHMQVFEVVRRGWRQSSVSTDNVRVDRLDHGESLTLHRRRVEQLEQNLMKLLDPERNRTSAFVRD